ncbi:MAG: acyltransferase family protein [Butyrivibrio sp.]|nr:acyltransferase family protein [Butyrivibrio sp.]
MNKTKDRQSNIELLRILAALGVIILHYNNPTYGKGFTNAAPFSANQFVLILLEALTICAVNVFVIITGYFMVNAKRADIFKPVRLLFQQVFFAIVSFAICFIYLKGNFPKEKLVSFIAPLSWFTMIFSALYLLSPFLNLLWHAMDYHARKTLLLVMFVLFSICSIIADIPQFLLNWKMQGVSFLGIEGDQSGYNIIQFIFMYYLGCMIRDVSENGDKAGTENKDFFHKINKTGTAVCAYVMSTAVILGATYVEMLVSKDLPPINSSFLDYNNPFVILQAVSLLVIFKNMKIQNTRLINSTSASTFTVYILHARFFELLGVGNYFPDQPLVLLGNVLVIAAAVYVLCDICHAAYGFITKPLGRFIESKWEKGRYISLQ